MNISKILSRKKPVIILFVVFAICIAVLSQFIPRDSSTQSILVPPKTSNSAVNNEKTLSVGLPMRLKIPVINVDAGIEFVDVTSKGEMDVPKSPANAAWYNKGPRPGEIGSSVIDGHYGWENNVPAVFDSLYKLKKGDKLYVLDAAGVTYTFVVNESKSYNPKADTASVFLSNDGKAHLNLITCEGTWDKSQKSYSNRLIVFADQQLQ